MERPAIKALWAGRDRVSHLLMESIPSNFRTSHSIYCCQKTSSSATEGTPRSVGTGCQCFPQCGLHEGPHFPSKQDKKFKEVMMLPQSLADTRRHGIACLLSCTAPSTSLLSMGSPFPAAFAFCPQWLAFLITLCLKEWTIEDGAHFQHTILASNCSICLGVLHPY